MIEDVLAELAEKGKKGLGDVEIEQEKVKRKWLEEDKMGEKKLKDLIGIIITPDVGSPTIDELLQVLGYETIYEALKAVVKEKGLWKDEWAKKE